MVKSKTLNTSVIPTFEALTTGEINGLTFNSNSVFSNSTDAICSTRLNTMETDSMDGNTKLVRYLPVFHAGRSHFDYFGVLLHLNSSGRDRTYDLDLNRVPLFR